MKKVCIAVLLLCGCFHVRLDEKTADAQVKKTMFATPFTDAVENDPCAATQTDLQSVRYSSNLGYAWLSVLTFGIVNFVNVEYSCAPQSGVKPAPLPDPDP